MGTMTTTELHEPVPGDPAPPTAGDGRRPATAELVAAAASAGAGLVHAAAAGSHGGDSTLMWLFALTAAAQLAWAGAMVLRPGRGVAAAGIVLNGAAALAWASSRTVGLVGPLRSVEAVGTQDLVAAVLATIAAIAAGIALRAPGVTRPASTVAVGLASALVLVLAVPAMAAEHTHGPSHEHGHGDAEVVASGHAHSDDRAHDDKAAADGDHGAGGHADTGQPVATGPISSVDDVRLTKVQRRAATDLLQSSRAALARFPDEASITAAGYRSIGDGRAVGKFEHFVNAAYMSDGRELDPSAIESIVMQRLLDGSKKVMSAMYILEPGKTMADVPEIAGELTVWHDHQNLCWDASGRLAGILRDGVCVPGGTFRPTAPMLHVWVDDPPCGPFTGIEGHGGGSCEHAHDA